MLRPRLKPEAAGWEASVLSMVQVVLYVVLRIILGQRIKRD